MEFKQGTEYLWGAWEKMADTKYSLLFARMWATRTQIRYREYGESFSKAVHEAYLEVQKNFDEKMEFVDPHRAFIYLVKCWKLGDQLQRWNNARAIRLMAEATQR
jgi:hypothetical protein